ncbi:hypothetical protein DNTS_020352, partial [Danionella cerebrum]
ANPRPSLLIDQKCGCVVANDLGKQATSVGKILGLMLVRKILDFIFSQHDLAWLDDILPEKEKKKREDEKKKKKKTEKKKDKKTNAEKEKNNSDEEHVSPGDSVKIPLELFGSSLCPKDSDPDLVQIHKRRLNNFGRFQQMTALLRPLQSSQHSLEPLGDFHARGQECTNCKSLDHIPSHRSQVNLQHITECEFVWKVLLQPQIIQEALEGDLPFDKTLRVVVQKETSVDSLPCIDSHLQIPLIE